MKATRARIETALLHHGIMGKAFGPGLVDRLEQIALEAVEIEQRLCLEALQEGALIARQAGESATAAMLQMVADGVRQRHRQVFDGLAVVVKAEDLRIR